MRVREEGVVAEIVGADPDGVDGFVGGEGEEGFIGSGEGVGRVGGEGRDLVF